MSDTETQSEDHLLTFEFLDQAFSELQKDAANVVELVRDHGATTPVVRLILTTAKREADLAFLEGLAMTQAIQDWGLAIQARYANRTPEGAETCLECDGHGWT